MIKSIKSIISMLTIEQKQQLHYAFEQSLMNQFIEYAPGKFVGVNIKNLPHLHIEQVAGLYSSGTISQGQKDVF